jgi:hypothetical protein
MYSLAKIGDFDDFDYWRAEAESAIWLVSVEVEVVVLNKQE